MSDQASDSERNNRDPRWIVRQIDEELLQMQGRCPITAIRLCGHRSLRHIWWDLKESFDDWRSNRRLKYQAKHPEAPSLATWASPVDRAAGVVLMVAVYADRSELHRDGTIRFGQNEEPGPTLQPDATAAVWDRLRVRTHWPVLPVRVLDPQGNLQKRDMRVSEVTDRILVEALGPFLPADW